MTGGTTGREIGMGIKGRIMMETVGAVKNLIRIINQVPKKMMVYAAHFSEDFEDSRDYGWNTTVDSFDWSRLIKNKDTEIDRICHKKLNCFYNNCFNKP